MANNSIELTATFHALADATRLAVIERLLRGPASVGELARPHDLALPTFLKHLKVLEGAGLIATSKSGRVRTVEIKTERLQSVEAWFADRRALWQRRLDIIETLLDDEE